jgi:plasmid stabilization system protein ParE
VRVIWSAEARSSYLSFLAGLKAVNPSAARAAQAEFAKATARLSKRPLIARPARWAGLREWSLPKWSKILVLTIRDDALHIIAFYDARQDLTEQDPRSDNEKS